MHQINAVQQSTFGAQKISYQKYYLLNNFFNLNINKDKLKVEENEELNDEDVKAKEQSAYRLAAIHVQLGLFDELVSLTK